MSDNSIHDFISHTGCRGLIRQLIHLSHGVRPKRALNHLAHGGYKPDIFVNFISHTGCEDIEIRLDT